MSEATNTETQTLLSAHAQDNPLVVYEARCSYTGTTKDNFLVGVHYVEHEEVSEEAWEAFKARWSEIIPMIRAELKYDAIENTNLYGYARYDYPRWRSTIVFSIRAPKGRCPLLGHTSTFASSLRPMSHAR